jgi:hypothetical protein
MSSQWKATMFLNSLLGIGVFLFSVTHAASAYPQEAEGPGEWSRPIDLSLGTVGENQFPTIIADAAGGVHVFWDESIEVNGGLRSWVDYAYWDGINWSPAVDVFIGSESWRSAWGAQAVVDSQGVMHTVWVDGFELAYAQRHVDSPVSARSWTGRVTLPASPGGSIGPVALALDDAGVLHVIYMHAGAPDPGVYHLRSEDGGKEWSSPLLISDPRWRSWPINQQRYVVDVLSLNDALHVVWYQQGLGLVYTQGRSNGQEWSSPEVIPGAGQWPSLVALDENQLLLLTTGAIDDDICLKLQNISQDERQTWSTAQRTAQPAKGCLGRVNAVRDAEDGYHLLMSGRTTFLNEPERIWYASGNGQRWQPAQLVTWRGVPYELLGSQPDFPSATISHGNILHAVFHTNSGRIWYTRRVLPASPAVTQAFPAPMPEPTATLSAPGNDLSSEKVQEKATERAAALSEELRDPSNQPLNNELGVLPIYLAAIPSGIMVGIFLLWNLLSRRNRY